MKQNLRIATVAAFQLSIKLVYCKNRKYPDENRWVLEKLSMSHNEVFICTIWYILTCLTSHMTCGWWRKDMFIDTTRSRHSLSARRAKIKQPVRLPGAARPPLWSLGRLSEQSSLLESSLTAERHVVKWALHNMGPFFFFFVFEKINTNEVCWWQGCVSFACQRLKWGDADKSCIMQLEAHQSNTLWMAHTCLCIIAFEEHSFQFASRSEFCLNHCFKFCLNWQYEVPTAETVGLN